MQYQPNHDPSQTTTKECPVFATDEELCRGCRKFVKIHRTDSSGQKFSFDLHIDIPRGSSSGFSRRFPGCGDYIGGGAYQDVLVVVARDPVKSPNAHISVSHEHTHVSAPTHYAGESASTSAYQTQQTGRYQHEPHSPATSIHPEAVPSCSCSPTHVPASDNNAQPQSMGVSAEQLPWIQPPLRVYKAGDASVEYSNNGDVEIQIRDYFDTLMEANFYREFVLVDQTTIIVRFSDFAVIGAFVEKKGYFIPVREDMLSGNVRVLFIADAAPKQEHAPERPSWSCF